MVLAGGPPSGWSSCTDHDRKLPLIEYDIFGVGHALVDLQFSVGPCELASLGVEKGVMTLVDADRRRAVLCGIGRDPVNRASGGSAANTAITVTRFGGRAYYAFQVGNDEWGRFYREDLQSAGVDSSPGALQPGETGQCLIMVTPDADRTMNTFLGASADMGPHQVDAGVIAASRFVYLEGYLLTTEVGFAACRSAGVAARSRGVAVALTLSDPTVVRTFPSRFEGLVDDVEIGLLLCNEDEAAAFTGVRERALAAEALAHRFRRVCVTLGGEGALVIDGDGGPVHIPGFPARAIDTTGAGDAFAGGVIYGLSRGYALAQAATLGNYGAAIVVSAFGPRLPASLAGLDEQILSGTAPDPSRWIRA